MEYHIYSPLTHPVCSCVANFLNKFLEGQRLTSPTADGLGWHRLHLLKFLAEKCPMKCQCGLVFTDLLISSSSSKKWIVSPHCISSIALIAAIDFVPPAAECSIRGSRIPSICALCRGHQAATEITEYAKVKEPRGFTDSKRCLHVKLYWLTDQTHKQTLCCIRTT